MFHRRCQALVASSLQCSCSKFLRDRISAALLNDEGSRNGTAARVSKCSRSITLSGRQPGPVSEQWLPGFTAIVPLLQPTRSPGAGSSEYSCNPAR